MTDTAAQHKHRHLRFEGVARLARPRPATSIRAGGQPAPRFDNQDNDTPLDGLLPWVLQRSGLDSSIYRPRPLLRRLPACLRALHATTPDEAMTLLARRPQLLPVALSALLLGVTQFFRDPPAFATLAGLLPTLRPSAPNTGLNICSLACSDGSELYSVAILLDELNLLLGSTLLGTDCREDAIAAARAGRYPARHLKHIPPRLRERYFRKQEDGWIVEDVLRTKARFEKRDLFADLPQTCGGSAWDVILWRNSAIYLRPSAAAEIWRQIARILRPGGLLVSGKAERPDRSAPFRRVDGCVFVRVSEGCEQRL